jgi:hypothetical protein
MPSQISGLDRRGADLDFRARERVLIERPKLQQRLAARGDFDPANRKALGRLDHLRPLPLGAGRAREVHRERGTRGSAVHAEQAALDIGAIVLPDRDDLRSAKAGDTRLVLAAPRDLTDQKLVHRFPRLDGAWLRREVPNKTAHCVVGIFAAFTSATFAAMSSLVNCANSAWLIGIGSTPSGASRFFTSSVCSALAISP